MYSLLLLDICFDTESVSSDPDTFATRFFAICRRLRLESDFAGLQVKNWKMMRSLVLRNLDALGFNLIKFFQIVVRKAKNYLNFLITKFFKKYLHITG